MRQAEKVVRKGDDHLVKAMDDGTVSISKAAELTEVPAEVRMTALAAAPKKRESGRSASDSKRKRRRRNASTKNQSAQCAAIVKELTEIRKGLTRTGAAIQKTGGNTGSHEFDFKDAMKRLTLAGTLVSHVLDSVK